MPSQIIKMRRTLSSKSGGNVTTLTQEGHDIEIDLDPSLFRRAGEALVKETKEAIRNIETKPSPTTIKRRRRKGILSTKLFIATGRLINSLQRVRTRDGWAVRHAADRLETPGLVERLAAEIKLDRIVDAVVKAVTEDLQEQWRDVDP